MPPPTTKQPFGLPTRTVMVVTLLVTISIIGGGWWLIPPILFGEGITGMHLLSAFITGQVFWSYAVGVGGDSFEVRRGGCEKCGAVKDEGTHHCSVCGRCVVGMDHHCLFLNVCVGDGNQKEFVKYVFWVAAATGYVFFLSAICLVDSGVPLEGYDLKQVLAFVLAFPTAIVPTLYPVIGLKKVALLTISISLQITAFLAILFTDQYYATYPTTFFIGLYLCKTFASLYLSASLGAPLVICFTLTLIFTTPPTRSMLSLAAASLSVCTLTAFLLVSHIVRLCRGVTTLEELKGLHPPKDRLVGWENIKKAMRAEGVVGVVTQLLS